jgi:ribosomal-protein-alanine N-acetyltransferase
VADVDLIPSERLVLRRWSASDLEGVLQLAGNPEVMRYIGSGATWDPEQTEAAHGHMLDHWQEHGFGARAMTEKETGKWIGFVEIQCAPPEAVELEPEDVEIGWWLDPSAWGRGFATEAAYVIRDESFERVGLRRIVGRYQTANAASGRVMEKLGMHFEREATGRHGEEVRIYGLDRKMWLAAQGNSLKPEAAIKPPGASD